MTAPTDARTLLSALRRGTLDAQSVTDAALERARETQELGAFLALADDARAPSSAARHAQPLHGLPIAVKDSIDVAGLPCTGGTPALRTWRPSHDAPVVRRLRDAGAVVIGKTSLHELSCGITSNNPTYGPVRNPHDPRLISGGSSGGSAVAVAAGVVPVALGADTAGSVRIPAALCGCVGFRPTTGRYPRAGVIPLATTRDTVGLLTRAVGDAMLVDEVITGQRTAPQPLHGRRLGVPRPYFYDDLDDELAVVVAAALRRLADAGAVLIETEVQEIAERTRPISLPLTLSEWPRDLGRHLSAGRCPTTVWEIADAMAGPVERGWLANELWGDGVPHEEYLNILGHGRPRLLAAYEDCFARDRLDALVLPTTRLPARPIGQDETVMIGDRSISTLEAYLRNTDPSSVIGLPSISVPAGLSRSGLPVGLSFDGLPGTDTTVLAIAEAYEGC
jgi:Asp-tRNA(Asn)/Glu-tRNA(Gln) amidotransferase A subunit family amidase